MDPWRGLHANTGSAAPSPAAAPPAAPPPAAMATSWFGSWPGAAYPTYAPSAYSVATSYATVAARSSQAYAQAQHLQQQQSTTASYNAAVRAQWPSAAPPASTGPAAPYMAAASAAKYATSAAPSFSSSAPTYASIAARPPPAAPPPKAAPPKPPAAASSGSAGWPPELRDYVERAFARARNDVEKSATEEQLKDVIQTAIHANLLWSRDWRNFPLPALPSTTQPPPPLPPSAAPPPPPPFALRHHAPVGAPTNSKVKPRVDPPPSFVPLSTGGAAVRKEKKHKLQLDEPDSFKARRAERFADLQFQTKKRKAWKDNTTHNTGGGGGASGGADEEAWAGLAIRGTSTELEKQYLRLTAPPDPATVRPLQVLRNALVLVKRKWKANQDYAHACEQLKSIRQDLTVQAIKEEFSAEVYEVHARLALENRDLSEFNQCQTQLFELFLCGVRTPASLEFIAYRVLYFVYRSAQSDLARLLVLLEPAVRRHPAVSHALSVHRALLMDNYASFFRLYLSAPNMSAYLMDLFIDSMRRTALRIISLACRPSLPLAWLQTQLAFEDLSECIEFVRQQSASLSPDGTALLLK